MLPDEDIPLHDRQIVKVMKVCEAYAVKERVLLPNNTYGRAAAVHKFSLMPGQIYRSIAELKSRGCTEEDLKIWFKAGALQYDTIGGLSRAKKRRSVPIALGNTTGSREQDAALGLRGQSPNQNRPNVTWGWHPSNLQGLPLSELQGLIAMTDQTIEIPKTTSECIAQLSRDN